VRVWEALERYWKPLREKQEDARRRSGTLHLAQAESNRGRRGCKRDFADAEGLVKRLVARELILSFVPDAEQRLWRTVTRQFHNRIPGPTSSSQTISLDSMGSLVGASAPLSVPNSLSIPIAQRVRRVSGFVLVGFPWKWRQCCQCDALEEVGTFKKTAAWLGNSLGNKLLPKKQILSEYGLFTLCKLLIPNNRTWDFSRLAKPL
jgi:hypothetical protein